MKMTRPLILLVAALLALAVVPARAQETPRVVKEADGKNEIVPGDVFEGNAATAGETNIIFLVCENDVICDMEITVPERGTVYLMADPYTFNSEIGVNLKLTRARFKKGRTEIRVRPAQAGDFKLTVTPWQEQPGFDIEPNNDPDHSQTLTPGQKMRATISRPGGDTDCFSANVEKGPIHVAFRRVLQASKERKLNGTLNLITKSAKGYFEPQNYFALNDVAEEFHFFPVVEKGPLWFSVGMGASCFQGDEYEIWWEPFTPGLIDAEKETAKAALASGEKWLREHGPGGKVYEPNPEAMDAFALMALLAGEAGKQDRQWLEDTYIRRIEGYLKLYPGVKWRGEDLFGHARIYDHAILTIALAEAVADGFESAKPACLKAAKYLLAAQLSGQRPAGWHGPVASTDESYGGWRYTPDFNNTDISATGWCLVALTAVDAAGISINGLRDSVRLALGAIRRCTDKGIFVYVPKSAGGGDIRSSIGALSLLLYGEGGSMLKTALADLDKHLPAGTQVEFGHNSPLYYAYYATRANYLRAGKAWETWRTAMLRQMLWRQDADGSWRPVHSEQDLGARFATSLSLMILRMCLNDVPKYLKHEAEGF